MLSRMLVAHIFSVAVAIPVFAEEAAPETSIKVYNVSDLASQNTLRQTVDLAHISPEEWRNEHVETIESLDRLASLVQAMCATKSSAVQPYRDTLSLVVRHTADGHREIDELLKTLRSGNQPSIRLTCQLVYYPQDENLSTSPEKQQRAEVLLMKKILTSEEAEEMKELVAHPQFAGQQQTVDLVTGRKTSWGQHGRPAFATARLVPEKHSVQLRVDYLADDIGEKFPVAAQVFEIPEGHSAMFLHICDGGAVVWLITPTPIEPAKK